MGCKGCPGKPSRSVNVDKYGNPIPHNPVMGEAEITTRRHANPQETHKHAMNMTYEDYVKKRAEWRAESKTVGHSMIQTFSEDYKRIQIEELVAVYNLDEVHFKLTPTQALAALYEFTQVPVYDNVFTEFEGLREQIITKYEELRKNRITLKWNG